MNIKGKNNTFNQGVKEHDAVSAESVGYASGKKFALVFVMFLIVIGGLISYQRSKNVKPPVRTMVVNRQYLQKRSRVLGIITRGLTGNSIDVNTGKIVKAARIFTPTDKKVYLELDLNNAPIGTIIDVIRYRGGRYVNHEELVLSKSTIQNVLFAWIISSLNTTTYNGNWKAATYENGILSKRVSYMITNSKLSSASEDKVESNDPDFKLSRVLAANTH